jgi:hypothetical protein
MYVHIFLIIAHFFISSWGGKLEERRGGDPNCGCHGNKTASWRIETGGGRLDLLHRMGGETITSPRAGVEFPLGGSVSMAAVLCTSNACKSWSRPMHQSRLGLLIPVLLHSVH